MWFDTYTTSQEIITWGEKHHPICLLIKAKHYFEDTEGQHEMQSQVNINNNARCIIENKH